MLYNYIHSSMQYTLYSIHTIDSVEYTLYSIQYIVYTL